jgi:hypothetical protein
MCQRIDGDPVLGFMSVDQVLFLTVYRRIDHCDFSLRRESSTV